MGLVPSRVSRGSPAIMSSCLPNFFSWVFYFVGPRVFPVGISWIQNFFLVGVSGVFRGSKSFSREYFVGPKFFSCGYFGGPKLLLVGILRVENFFSWVYFVGPTFFLVEENYFTLIEYFLPISLHTHFNIANIMLRRRGSRPRHNNCPYSSCLILNINAYIYNV